MIAEEDMKHICDYKECDKAMFCFAKVECSTLQDIADGIHKYIKDNGTCLKESEGKQCYADY